MKRGEGIPAAANTVNPISKTGHRFENLLFDYMINIYESELERHSFESFCRYALIFGVKPLGEISNAQKTYEYRKKCAFEINGVP